MTFAPPSLLKKMWHEFSLTETHIIYNEPLKLNNLVIAGDFSGPAHEALVSNVQTVDSMRVDLPELNFALDAEQFFTTVDVIRNVLLAPPPPKRNYEVETKSAAAFVREGRESLIRESSRSVSLSASLSVDTMNDDVGGSRPSSTTNVSGLKRRAERRRESNPNST